MRRELAPIAWRRWDGDSWMNIKMMVVDDNAVVREGFKQMLDLIGVKVVAEATTCAEARALAAEPSLDLVLLDIRLPDGLGFDVLTQLAMDRPNLPVLMHSVHDQPTYMARSHSLGAKGYLVKGSEFDQIVAAIRTAAQGDSAWTAPQLATIERRRRSQQGEPSDRKNGG